MNKFNVCSANLTEELKSIVKNTEIETQDKNLSEQQRISYLRDKVDDFFAEEKAQILVNARVFSNLKSYIDDVKELYKNKTFKPSYTKIINSLLSSNVLSSKGSRNSMEAQSFAFQGKYLGDMIVNFKNVEHYNLKGGLDVSKEADATINNNIKREIARLNGNDVKPTNDKTALEYAKEIIKTKTALIKELKIIGLKEENIKKYAGEQTHDANNLIKVGFNQWYDELINSVDLQVNNFLQNKTISQNVYNFLTQNASGISMFDVPSGMKKSLQNFIKTKEFAFKSIEEEINYSNNYGMAQSEMLKLGKSIEKYATMTAEFNVLGSFPEEMLNRLINYAKTKSDKPVDEKKIYNIYNEVKGNISIGSPALARVGSNIRKAASTTMFGGVVLNTPIFDRMTRSFLSFTDNGKYGNYLFDLFTSVPKGLNDIGQIAFSAIDPNKKGGFTAEETKHLNTMGLAVDSYLAMSQRYFQEIDVLGAGSGITKKIDGMSKFFGKVSGLEILDNHQMANNYAQKGENFQTILEKNDYNLLNAFEKQEIGRYSIGEAEYKVLSNLSKQTAVDPALKVKMFNFVDIKTLTLKDLEEYIKPDIDALKEIKTTTNRTLTQEDINLITDKAKIKLENLIRTYYNTEARIALGKRDTGSNFFARGTQAGTVGGEATRLFQQAKSYPMLYLRNIFENIYYNTALNSNMKWASYITFAAMGTLAGYGQQQLTELKNNKSTKAPTPEMLLRAMSLSGFGGFYGDALNSFAPTVFDYTKKTGYTTEGGVYRGIYNFLAGPVISKATDVLVGVNYLVAKKPDADKFIKAVKNATPFNNIFYLNGTINYLTMAISESVGGKGLSKERKRLRKEKDLWGEDRDLLFDPFN